MRYEKLVRAIQEEGYSLEHFAHKCGIDEDYFVAMLGSDDDFEPEEFWDIAAVLGIGNNVEAQDELFFCG